jgi:hypothetical protein
MEAGYKHLIPMEQFKASHKLTIYLLYYHPLGTKVGGSRMIPDMVTGRGIQYHWWKSNHHSVHLQSLY